MPEAIDLTVITSSVPGRADMLAECIESVQRQSFRPMRHLISVDAHKAGESTIRNELLRSVDTDWVAFLDDDDLYMPNHFEVLWGHREDFEVVYGWPMVNQWRRGFNAKDLQRGNFIPMCAPMILTAWVEEVKGFPDGQNSCEDHVLWKRLLNAGARFKCVEEGTYMIRSGGNREIRPYWETAHGQDLARA